MGVMQRLRLQVQTVWERADYIARTEGVAAMVRRMAGSAGLRQERAPDAAAPQPVAQQLSDAAAQAWPLSLLVIGDRPAGLAPDLPLLVRSPDASDVCDAQQLVSAVLVVGLAGWRDRVAQEAARLRQPILLHLGAADDAGDSPVLARVTAVLGPAPAGLPTGPPVIDADGIGPFLRGLRAES